jgi:hypothetical protein
MRSVLTWIMATRWRAASAAFVTGGVQWLGPLSAGVVSLVGLRRGPAEGLLVVLVAVIPLAALGAFAGTGPTALAVPALALWLPMLALAEILRRTDSLALAFQAAGVLGWLIILAVFVGLDSPQELGREFLDRALVPWLERSGEAVDPEALDRMALLVPGVIAAALSLTLAIGLILGRWWQAVLYNPGGFRADFHALRHGPAAAVAAGVIFILSALLASPVLENMALVAMLVMLFQGLAVCHALVHCRRMNGAWLVPVYGMLVLIPLPALAALAGIGIIDNVTDIRARLTPRQRDEDGPQE